MRAIVLASTALVLPFSPALAQTVSVPPTVIVPEGSPWSVPVTRIGPKTTTLSFTFCTVPDTALAGTDYVARCGSQSIRKNAMTYTINGLSIDNSIFGSDKRFFLDVTAKGQAPVRTAIVLRDNDPAPPPPPPPPGDELSVTPQGQPGIVGPQESKLLTGWPLTKSAAPDTVGAFRFDCTAGPAFRDDPIVYPGQPGRSHLHRFFGPVSASGYADYSYRKLRETEGDVTTCQGLLPAVENATLYWMPELFIGKKAYIWEHGKIYYKRYPKGSKECDGVTPNVWGTKQTCEAIPNGIKFIWGYDMLTSTVPTGSTQFWSQATPTSALLKFDDIQAAFEATPVGGRFGMDSVAPGCWDGKRTDSANHRDHVANPARASNGQVGCKPTHPVVIPGFSFKPSWPVTAQAKSYYALMKAAYPNAKCIIQFASDPMARLTNPDLKCGGSAHMDYMEGWDPAAAKPAWIDNCINRLLNCSSGETGDGRAIPGAGRLKQWIDPAIITNGWLQDLPADISDALEEHIAH